MKTKRALVTGATGHIGSMLCRALLDGGFSVKAFVREGSSREAIADLNVEIATGDVLDGASLVAAARGSDVVFHAAAVFAIHTREPDLLERVATTGTRNAVFAAKHAGARLVHTSSVSAVGFGRAPGDVLDEDSWATDLTVPYYRAKLAAERIAIETAAEHGVELVRVLPTLVLGPGDYRLTPSSKLFVDMLAGRGATADGGGNVIDVRDAATAMIVAGERGRAGARYILGGENVNVRDLGIHAERLTGRAVPHVSLPRWAMSGIAAGMELASSFTGKSPALTRAAVRDVFGRYGWYDVTRARTELGLTARPLEETLTDTARFFEERGLCTLKKKEAA